jgi:hypothetical protein
MQPSNAIMAMGLAVMASSVVFAQPAKAQSLIEMRNVDRDAVPAGTPAAFAEAFPDAQRNEAVREVGKDSYSFTPLAFIPLSDTMVALVSVGANACSGHACAGLNAVHYLSHDTGEPRYPFTLKGEWMDVGSTGTYGNPAAKWGWTTEIADHPVLYTEAGGSWQGRSCGYAVLTELTPLGPVEIARLQTYFSDAGSDDGDPGVEGVITVAEKGRSFTVSYKGAAEFAETYRRGADGRYRLEGSSRVTAC